MNPEMVLMFSNITLFFSFLVFKAIVPNNYWTNACNDKSDAAAVLTIKRV